MADSLFPASHEIDGVRKETYNRSLNREEIVCVGSFSRDREGDSGSKVDSPRDGFLISSRSGRFQSLKRLGQAVNHFPILCLAVISQD